MTFVQFTNHPTCVVIVTVPIVPGIWPDVIKLAL